MVGCSSIGSSAVKLAILALDKPRKRLSAVRPAEREKRYDRACAGATFRASFTMGDANGQ